jgi:IS30 family transposase
MSPAAPTKKAHIKDLHSEGKENVYIADKVGVHKSTVGQILSKMEEHPDPYYQAPCGHQKHILGNCDMRQAERMINSGQACDGADV